MIVRHAAGDRGWPICGDADVDSSDTLTLVADESDVDCTDCVDALGIRLLASA